jgi:hypothetical protein
MLLSQGALRSVAEALFCREEGPPPADRLDWLCADFDDFISQAGVRAQTIINASLMAVTWVAPLTIRQAPPLGRLSLAQRCHALEAMEETDLGLAVLALKALLSIIYYEHPDSMAEIGVDKTCLGERT